MLKLVINNTQPLHGRKADDIPLTLPSKNPFLFNFQQTSHNLYFFSAFDSDHGLACKMNVELKESYIDPQEGGEGNYLVPVAFCNFPNIDMRQLAEKVGWDDYLHVSIMIQFQLEILEQLLLFCGEKGATQLVLTISEVSYDDLEIYRHFAFSEVQVMTAEREQTEIAISSGVETYDEVVEFTDEFDADFRKDLWRNQKNNPLFRRYLIGHSLLVQ